MVGKIRRSTRRQTIDVALGNSFADLAVINGRVVNVLTAEIYPAGIAVKTDRIAAVGDIAYTIGPDTEVIDAEGRYLTPGLVDGHLHMYHTYIGINEFVEGMLRHGVTSYADGFYGQGIVGGREAIRFFKETIDRTPLRLLFVVPTLAHLQNRELGLTPTEGISIEDMHEMLEWEGCVGLEEPPYLPICEQWEDYLDLFDLCLQQRKTISGHGAGIHWRQLQAYAAMGAGTDHEAVAADEAVEKARVGIRLLMRQASGGTDVPALVKSHTEMGIDSRMLAMCADVASPEKLLQKGGLDENVRVAIANGVNPVTALQMATINVAEIFGMHREIGALAPGNFADILLVDDLCSFKIARVIVGGSTVVDRDRFLVTLPKISYPRSFGNTVRIEKPLTPADLEPRTDRKDRVTVRVIGVTDGTLTTDDARAELPVVDGVIQPDLAQDILPLAMVDRFGKGQLGGGKVRIGNGFVSGFGLKRGAIASTVNAVCENLVAVGANTADMAFAMNKLAEVEGGKIVVLDGEILALVELPLLGLLSKEPMAIVAAKFEKAFAAIRHLGCELASPFAQLEFSFACGEIGHLRLSDEGLLRVDPPEMVDLVVA